MAAVTNAPRHNIDLVMEEVGLEGEANRLVSMFSGGQIRRVSLAMVLISNPELLVLDEPTVGLDPVLRGELWTLFRELCQRGVTMIISSRVMDEALRCDDLILMREGRIIAETTPDALLIAPSALIGLFSWAVCSCRGKTCRAVSSFSTTGFR